MTSSDRGPGPPFLPVASSDHVFIVNLRRLAMQNSVLLAPPMLSYVPFGAARTSPLSYVAFGTAGVSYAGGAAALKSKETLRSQNDRFVFVRTNFVTSSGYQLQLIYRVETQAKVHT